jgi:multidrug/hemolysin transport system permease protein
MIIQFVKRNLLMYFKDRLSVFFSLLGVFVIVLLYVLFLGNMMVDVVDLVGDDGRFFMDSWIMAGVIAVSSITTTMGALGTMVEDVSRKAIKDFEVAPFKRWKLVLAYILSSIVIGLIMSLLTFALAEVYIVIYGGHLVSFIVLLKILGVVTLSVASSSAMVFFLTTFMKTTSSFATASTLLGTLIGFFTGIYVPVGSLPEGVQVFIKYFPGSHSAVLMRQLMMNEAYDLTYVPQDVKTLLGVNFTYGEIIMPFWGHILVLIGSMLLFFGLSILVVSRRKRKE